FSTSLAPSPHLPASLHDALPISRHNCSRCSRERSAKSCGNSHEGDTNSPGGSPGSTGHYGNDGRNDERNQNDELWIDQLKPIVRSEEHTSELQSRFDLVCRLLLE